MERPMRERRAELLEDLVSQTEFVLVEAFGLAPDVANHVGHALADHLAMNWGGQSLSFPKDANYFLSVREQAILAEAASGASTAQLARKYGMTERGLRMLLRRAEARQSDSRQGTFDLG